MTKYEQFARLDKDELIELRSLISLCDELRFLEDRENIIMQELFRRIPSIENEFNKKEEHVKVKMINGVIFDDKK